MNFNHLKQVKLESTRPTSVDNFSNNVVEMKNGYILKVSEDVTIVLLKICLSDGIASKIKEKYKINTNQLSK